MSRTRPRATIFSTACEPCPPLSSLLFALLWTLRKGPGPRHRKPRNGFFGAFFLAHNQAGTYPPPEGCLHTAPPPGVGQIQPAFRPGIFPTLDSKDLPFVWNYARKGMDAAQGGCRSKSIPTAGQFSLTCRQLQVACLPHATRGRAPRIAAPARRRQTRQSSLGWCGHTLASKEGRQCIAFKKSLSKTSKSITHQSPSYATFRWGVSLKEKLDFFWHQRHKTNIFQSQSLNCNIQSPSVILKGKKNDIRTVEIRLKQICGHAGFHRTGGAATIWTSTLQWPLIGFDLAQKAKQENPSHWCNDPSIQPSGKTAEELVGVHCHSQKTSPKSQ